MDQYLEIKRFAIVTAIIISVILVSVVVLIGSEPPDSSIQVSTLEFVIATGEVFPSEDLNVSVGTVTLYVPNDAIDIAGSIAMTTREPNLFPVAGETEWSRPHVVNIEFRTAEGILVPFVILSKPAQLCFKVTPEQLQDYLSHQDKYQVHYYAEQQDPPGWEYIPMVSYPERNELCGQTDHLSLFALAIKREPGIPVTSVTSTPKPKTFLDRLSDLFSQGSDGSSGQPDGAYKP